MENNFSCGVIYMLDKIISNTSLIKKSLDASWTKNEAISQNIANVDTPGYKRKTVKFEEFINTEMKKSKIANGQSKLSGDDIKVSVDTITPGYRLDGNNVDIEREMALMAENSIRYNTLIKAISGQYSRLNIAINGRR